LERFSLSNDPSQDTTMSKPATIAAMIAISLVWWVLGHLAGEF